MYIPSEPEEAYFSITYSNTYIIIINTSVLNDRQIKWLKNELSIGQKYSWIIVIGQASLNHLNIHSNFTEIFMDYHTNMYIYYGEFYGCSSIKYPLTEHSHIHFQDDTELLVVQQGPSWTDFSNGLFLNNNTYATKQDGFGILNLKYSTLQWQEFSSQSHLMINQAIQYRIDLAPRKPDEVKSFKIIFVITFLIFFAAFVQVFVQKELEKRRLNSHKPLESGIIDY